MQYIKAKKAFIDHNFMHDCHLRIHLRLLASDMETFATATLFVIYFSFKVCVLIMH
jgi:hypothetical protein